MSNNLARLDRYKLDSIFTDTNVTHRMIKSDILTGSRRIEVLTTWVQERELGAGSFGEVSLQRELVSGELRAVKSIDKRRWRVHEMDALIDLQDHHYLFVHFLGWYESPLAVHIAMEYIPYGDLGQYMTDNPVTARLEAKVIALQILEGLVVLHKREICHRDLKPQNILMASLTPLWLKLADFGIAKNWTGTALRTQCGTVAYQAPEISGLLPDAMTQGVQMYTSSIDIWSLGVVIHQVLTSTIPFLKISEPVLESGFPSESESTVDIPLLVDYCRSRNPFPVASLIGHGASPNAINFVQILMVPDPKKRVSAAEALQDLWLAKAISSGTSNSPTASLSGSQIPLSIAQPRSSDTSQPTANEQQHEGKSSKYGQATRQTEAPPRLPPLQVISAQPRANPRRRGNPSSTPAVETPGPILILIMGGLGCGIDAFAHMTIQSGIDIPVIETTRDSCRMSRVINLGRHRLQLLLAPENADEEFTSGLIEDWQGNPYLSGNTPGRKIHGILRLRSDELKGKQRGFLLERFARHCVPYLSQDMVMWAVTSWEKTSSSRGGTQHFVLDGFGKFGKDCRYEPSPNTHIRCLAVLRTIAEGERSARLAYRPVGANPPAGAGVDWI